MTLHHVDMRFETLPPGAFKMVPHLTRLKVFTQPASRVGLSMMQHQKYSSKASLTEQLLQIEISTITSIAPTRSNGAIECI